MKIILIVLTLAFSQLSYAGCKVLVPEFIEITQDSRDLALKGRSKHISTNTEIYASLINSINDRGYTIVRDFSEADLEILDYDVWVQETGEGFNGAASIRLHKVSSGEEFAVNGGMSIIFYKTNQASAIEDAFEELRECKK